MYYVNNFELCHHRMASAENWWKLQKHAWKRSQNITMESKHAMKFWMEVTKLMPRLSMIVFVHVLPYFLRFSSNFLVDVGETSFVTLGYAYCWRVLISQRNWKNDSHMAVRDLNQARKIKSSSFKAHFCMSEALSQVRFWSLCYLLLSLL